MNDYWIEFKQNGDVVFTKNASSHTFTISEKSYETYSDYAVFYGLSFETGEKWSIGLVGGNEPDFTTLRIYSTSPILFWCPDSLYQPEIALGRVD